MLLLQQDAILKVTSTAICGSDLHMYTGAMPGMTKGDLLGHEVRAYAHSSNSSEKVLAFSGSAGGHGLLRNKM